MVSRNVGTVATDLVVAIARGASRLLELHASWLHVPVVSQHAIPFMEEGEILDKRILVFDDSIIFGSTMAEVAGYLQARGATVSNAAYVVDRTFRDPSNPNSSTLKPLVICKELNKEQVRIHHAELVHKIYQRDLI